MRCSKSVSLQHAVIVASCLLACCATAWADSILVWNRFESEYNVEHSNYGPNFHLRNYIYDSWDEAYIGPARFSNGLCVNHDTNQGYNNDGANFFALDLWEAGLTANQGTIDFWFKYGYDCSADNTAFFFHTGEELTGHYDQPPRRGWHTLNCELGRLEWIHRQKAISRKFAGGGGAQDIGEYARQQRGAGRVSGV